MNRTLNEGGVKTRSLVMYKDSAAFVTLPSSRSAALSKVRELASGGLEMLWLLAAIFVPIIIFNPDFALSEARLAYVEVPKIGLLRTIAGLMAVLWLIEWSAVVASCGESWSIHRQALLHPGRRFSAMIGWFKGPSNRWIVAAVWFFLGTTILGTVFAVDWRVSLWGEVSGQDSYAAYTIIAYVLIFGVVASHLKTGSQLWRLLAAIIISGVLISGYGILQYLNHDFLGISTEVRIARVTSFMGNPIFAGSAMLMTFLASIMAANINLRNRGGERVAKAVLANWGFWLLILTIQLIGMIYTFSRGPWLGTIAGLVLFLVLVAYFRGWRLFVRSSVILGLTAVLALMAIQWRALPNAFTKGDWPILAAVLLVLLLCVTFAVAIKTYKPRLPTYKLPATVGLVLGIAAFATILIWLATEFSRGPIGDPGGLAQITSRLDSIGSEFSRGTISGRTAHWLDSWKLIRDRPWFEFDDLSLKPLRPFIGYGPDIFRSVYLLESHPRSQNFLPASPDQAHNYFVHQAVELGVLGFISSLALFLMVFSVGIYQLVKKAGTYSDVHTLMLIGLLAVFGGRFVEQMAGLAKSADMTIFWILLGVLVALPSVMRISNDSEEPDTSGPARSRTLSGTGLWSLAVAAALIGCIITLTWLKAVSYPRAAVVAAGAIEPLQNRDYEAAIAKLSRAIDLAPDVHSYYSYRAIVYRAYLRDPSAVPDQECTLQSNIRYDVCLAQRAYMDDLKATKLRPLYWQSKLGLAASALDLFRLDEAIDLHWEVIKMVPYSWPLRNQLADLYIQSGDPATSLEVLGTSLIITKSRPAKSARAFMLQGIAYLQLGQPNAAINSLEKAFELGLPKKSRPRAHTALAVLYQESGQQELAERHRKAKR